MIKTFIIAEIGINHNGDFNIAKKLIDGAANMGCDAVKFQKRTIDIVYTKEQLDSFRDSPWGKTFREQKEGIEFGEKEYELINEHCKKKGIAWFASAWDLESQKFLQKFNLKYNKIASAMLINKELLEMVAREGRYTFISTGMSNYEEIDYAVNIFNEYNCPFELMHTNSTYPMKNEDANLLMIRTLQKRYNCKVGYSGHEVGRIISLAAVAIGATSLERHITLDRTMYGTDQAASLPVKEFRHLVEDIRTLEPSFGSGEKILSESELAVRKKLRGY